MENESNAGGRLQPVTSFATGRSKANISVLFFGSAMLNAAKAKAIEKGSVGRPDAPSDRELDDHRALVLGGLTMVLAALEASLNEFIAEIVDDNSERVGPVLSDDRGVSALLSLWPEVERPASLLGKHDLVLTAFGRPAFGKGDLVYQNADCVVALRNALVHFKPEWPDKDKAHAKLERRLQDKFDSNPLLAPGFIWFPFRCLSADCLRWTCDSVSAYPTRLVHTQGRHNCGHSRRVSL